MIVMSIEALFILATFVMTGSIFIAIFSIALRLVKDPDTNWTLPLAGLGLYLIVISVGIIRSVIAGLWSWPLFILFVCLAITPLITIGSLYIHAKLKENRERRRLG
jgi:multisubunit Na+/H+ antiporter MnhG subunit